MVWKVQRADEDPGVVVLLNGRRVEARQTVEFKEDSRIYIDGRIDLYYYSEPALVVENGNLVPIEGM